jgi:integrase
MTENASLTDAMLRKMKATGDRFEITDGACVGLRIRVSPKGDKAFVLKSRNSVGQIKTITLGHYPSLSLKQAREAANFHRLELKAGRDVNAERKKDREAAKTKNQDPTLSEILIEYEAQFSASRRSWAPRGKRSVRSNARGVIEAVLKDLLEQRVSDISIEQFGAAINAYEPMRPINGKSTANGQASRARSYLMPVFNWAAGRRSFSKAGAGRIPKLQVISVEDLHDPSSTDNSITGDRERVLSEDELRRILPLLVYPAPKELGAGMPPELDYRPIAMRFILLTAARREEVEGMRFKDVDFQNGVWRKPSIKSTRKGPRSQSLPLSQEALKILNAMAKHNASEPDGLIFPNSKGGKLGNWQRIQTALYRASGTKDWHRHDLRRTASSIMEALKVPLSTIDQILGHTNPLKRENLSGAASHYIRLGKTLKSIRDPQEVALSDLAAALDAVVTNVAIASSH